MPLPSKVVGGYWENWGSGPKLGEIATEFNTVFVAFAQGVNVNSGKLQFSPQIQSSTSFKADVKKLQARGVKVILSIGGWYDMPNMTWGYKIDNSTKQNEAVASIKSLVTEYGFDGIDWDLEHGINYIGLVEVSEQLKRDLGSDFIIAAVPAPNSSEYLSFAKQLGNKLDFIGPQYYDRNMSEVQSRAEIIAHTRQLIAAVGAERVGIGARNVATVPGSLVDTNNVVTLATYTSVWQELVREHPKLKGMYVWSVTLDASVGYAFAKTMSKIIGPTTNPENPTAPLPAPEFYVILAGDTIRAIAAKFGLSWEDIVFWNKLENPAAIFPGQQIRLKPPVLQKTIKDLAKLPETADLKTVIAAYNELLGILQK